MPDFILRKSNNAFLFNSTLTEKSSKFAPSSADRALFLIDATTSFENRLQVKGKINLEKVFKLFFNSQGCAIL